MPTSGTGAISIWKLIVNVIVSKVIWWKFKKIKQKDHLKHKSSFGILLKQFLKFLQQFSEIKMQIAN